MDTKFFIVVAALLTPVAAVSASEPRVPVVLVFEGRSLTAPIATTAIKEAEGIWARYGVDVRSGNAADSVGPDAVKLTVKIITRRDVHVAINALGSIAFVDDSPEPVIQMYSDAISELTDASTLPAYANQASPLHDVVIGRVLGRALAHEIGHYLLRQRQHTVSGLMRARHSIIDFIGPERAPFTLGPDELMRLESVVSARSTADYRLPSRSAQSPDWMKPAQ